MGGHAFCIPSLDKAGNVQPALYTPRLLQRVYEAMKEIVIQNLKELFHHVVIPIEHPEKTDHGDVDVLVCGFRDELSSKSTIFDLREDIARQLGADESRSWCDGNHTGFFAVPVPASIISLGSVPEPGLELPMLGSSRQYWVQVDVQVVTAPSQLQWRRFRLDHATLQPILTLGLRPAGFIFMNDGFYIRIPGPDRPFGEDHPKTPLIFLTSDFSRLLQFLGLPLEPYDQLFDSFEMYWSWITSARHFARDYLQPRLELEKLIANKAGKSSKDRKVSGYTSGLAYYFSRRDSMRMFTDVWLPAHSYIGNVRINTEDIFQEALTFFDARERYHTQWRIYRNERIEGMFWDKVVVKLSEIRRADLARQAELEMRICEENAANKRVNLMTFQLAEGPRVDNSGETTLEEQKERKKIRKIVNEAVLTLKRRVIFESRPGYGKYPVVKEEPMNDIDHPKWWAELDEGGLTEDFLIDWIASHGFALLKNERDRTRPAREAKRVAKKKPVNRNKYSGVTEGNIVEQTLCNRVRDCRI